MSDVGRYRRISNNRWHSPAFRRLNNDARMAGLYAEAGPQTTSVGCFRLSTAVAIEDLGGTPEAFEEHLEAACEAFGWAWDPVARVIWITDWFENNPPANPNVVQSWAKLLRNVPDCDVKTQAIASIGKSLKDLPSSFRDSWRELSKLFPSGNGNGNGLGNTHPQTIQGSRDAGRSGRSGREEQARAEERRTFVPVDPRAIAIADKTIKLMPNGSEDELIDAFGSIASNEGKQFTRAIATAALTEVRQQRRAS